MKDKKERSLILRKRKMKKRTKKKLFWIGMFLGVLIFEAFLIGMLVRIIPDDFEVFGVPFGLLYFIWGILVIILYIFLRKIGISKSLVRKIK